METVFFYVNDKVISRHRHVNSTSFNAFAHCLKRHDHHLPDHVDKRVDEGDRREIIVQAQKAPFDISKYKGQYKFKFSSVVPNFAVDRYQIQQEMLSRGAFRKEDLPLSGEIPWQVVHEYAESKGYVIVDQPDDKTQFVRFATLNQGKGSWPYEFTNNMIFVSQPKGVEPE
jgi:hypothetical protein